MNHAAPQVDVRALIIELVQVRAEAYAIGSQHGDGVLMRFMADASDPSERSERLAMLSAKLEAEFQRRRILPVDPALTVKERVAQNFEVGAIDTVKNQVDKLKRRHDDVVTKLESLGGDVNYTHMENATLAEMPHLLSLDNTSDSPAMSA